MSSSTLDRIMGYIGYIQRKELITKERFASLRQYFFQSVGFLIILYCFSQLLMLLNLFLKLLLYLIFQILSVIFLLPSKSIALFMPKTNNYNIIIPLFWLCSIFSFFIAKFSHKNAGKRHSFILIFIILLLLQSVVILLPITISIHEQRKLTSTPVDVKGTAMTPSEMSEMAGREDNLIKNWNNDNLEELISVNEEMKLNKATKNLSQKKIINLKNRLSSSLDEDSNIQSDVEDEQGINIDEKPSHSQVSSNEEQELLFKQQANKLVDSIHQFSSKVLENPAEIIEENTEQIEDSENRKNSFHKFGLEKGVSVIFRQIFHDWLEDTWNIWHQIKHYFLQLSSLSEKYSPRHNFSSVYTAFTDLNCYDYTKSMHRYKEKYIYFLNTYRHQSPFPIYLSIIKTNGPTCHPRHPKSSCAVRSKLFFPDLKRQLYRFTRFWVIISIPMVIFIVMYKWFRYRQLSNLPNRSSKTTDELPSKPIATNINNNNYPLDQKIEKELQVWLEHEYNNGYQNIRESCRIALNETFSKQSEQLRIETLQFANAKIHHVSQTSMETVIINAILDMDDLIFNVIKEQDFSIQIPKLTGELEIHLINTTIDVTFKQIKIDNAEIIDPKNVLSSDEKELFIKLLEEVIKQTIVQCSFYLHDIQEKVQLVVPPIAPPSPDISTILPIAPPSPDISEQCETPIITSINDIHQPITPEKEVKKLLVRIVKAVKLHDVEQPFCTLELNHPNQIHQTSIAKNGLNPYWDERFLFECNDKSNQIRLKIIDHKKPHTKKFYTHHPSLIDTIYADVSIPFAYVTSTIYKQDVRIMPQYPDSIIRIEFSTLTEEEALIVNHGCDIESASNSPSVSNDKHGNKTGYDYQPLSSNEILTLGYNTDGSSKVENKIGKYPSPLSPPRTTDVSSTISPDDGSHFAKPRKSHSFMGSFRFFSRRKKQEKKGKPNENGLNSPLSTPTQTNSISHSFSTEPYLPPNTTDPTPVPRRRSISRSFRNIFRSNLKKKPLTTDNFIIDHPDFLPTSTPTPKKRSFFRRFKSKQKPRMNFSTNSLTSDDCTRSESVRNTPVRANVGRPVTMTNSHV